MNTRLQVEHPVTELVTGLDLVEQMIRVAAGEKLAIGQDDVELRGWAVEARIYAEDPYRGFLPSTGRLTRYRPPEADDHIRVDDGVFEGGEISMFYDPMIAKLCAHDISREQAIARLREALDKYQISGVAHNVPFLAAVAAHPRFQEGRLSTGFIAEEYPEGFQGFDLDDKTRTSLIAVAVLLHRRECLREATISGRLGGRPLPRLDREWVVGLLGENHSAEASEAVDGCDVVIDGDTFAVRSHWHPGEPLFRGSVNAREIAVQVVILADGFRLTHGGVELDVTVRTPRAAQLAALMPHKAPPDTSKLLLCPMPGLVVSIPVSEGEEVKAGQVLAVVEAMKMENVLRAELDGVISSVPVRPGDSLAVDQVILEFE